MSVQVKSEAEFRKWRKRARELRAGAEHSPEDVPVILELLGDMEKLQRKIQKHEQRIRTLEAQVQKAYADHITGSESIESEA